MSTIKFNEKLAKKIAVAQEKANKANEKAVEKLLDNESFIEAQRAVAAKEEEVKKLNEIITQLNSISPFVANDGRKFGINVFPIPVFGIGLGSVMGIIAGSRNAFTDDKMLEYSAITGISMLELIEARDAMGNPSYFANGKINDATPGDYSKLSSLLEGIFVKLGLSEFKASDITRDKYDLWFAVGDAKAHRQAKEHDTLQELEEGTQDFCIED